MRTENGLLGACQTHTIFCTNAKKSVEWGKIVTVKRPNTWYINIHEELIYSGF